jgi:integrase
MSNRRVVESLSSVRSFLDSKCRNSIDSRNAYLTGLVHFDNFLSPRHTIESVLKPLLEGQLNVYELLDSFVSNQMSKLSIKTTRLNLAVMKSYFGFHDIDIIPSKFQRKVTLPKIHKEKEQPIDVSDIRKILLACNNRRLKAYVLILASGGMRAVEALAIRLKDIDCSVNPTKIHIRKEYAKTRVARDIYVSEEATQYLKSWLDWKYRNGRLKTDDDLVFGVGRSTDPRSLYTEVAQEFANLLEIAGYSERKEDSSRHKITIHSMRRFVDSTITDLTGKDYAEWFLGHADNSYYTKKESDRHEIYATKCLKYLTFLDYTTLESTGKSIEAKLYEKEKEIQSIKQKYDQDIQTVREEMNQQFGQIMSIIQQNPRLAHVKPEALAKKRL